MEGGTGGEGKEEKEREREGEDRVGCKNNTSSPTYAGAAASSGVHASASATPAAPPSPPSPPSPPPPRSGGGPASRSKLTAETLAAAKA